MSKLQTKFGSYELENHYNALSESLPFRPAIFRQCGLDAAPWHLTEQLNLLQDITWSRLQYRAEPNYDSQLRNGNFNDGQTIQPTAPEG
jgi:hypothetical protein